YGPDNQFDDSIFEGLSSCPNLKEIDFTGIPINNFKLINFKDHTNVENCFIDGLNIQCIQKGTCKNDFRWIRECNQEEIDEVLSTQSSDFNKTLKIIITSSIIIIVSIVVFIYYFRLNKKVSSDQKSDIIVTHINHDDNHFNFRSSIINDNYRRLFDSNSIENQKKDQSSPPSYEDAVNDLFSNIHDNLIAISNTNDINITTNNTNNNINPTTTSPPPPPINNNDI
ncbi:hypothetical protein PIROE2DRAFT_65446, partial [Piromyces sp. E2]